MSFLGLGKKKKNINEKLDVPPMPPPGMEQKEFPEIPPSQEEFPPLVDTVSANEKQPEIPSLDDIPGPGSDFNLPPPPKDDLDQQIPSLDNNLKIHDQIPKEDAISHMNMPSDYSNIMPEPVAQPKPAVKPNIKKESIPESKFVVIERFKVMIQDINLIKSNLKEFEGELTTLGSEEKSEDGLYSKMKNNLMSINRTLKSMDKILFEG